MSRSALMVKKYREHARQLRLVARDTMDPCAGTLRTIADDYERLARTIEALARESRPVKNYGLNAPPPPPGGRRGNIERI